MDRLRLYERLEILGSWIILTVSAMAVGFLILTYIFKPIATKGPFLLDALVPLLILGILVPIAQLVVISRFFPKPYLWLFVTIAGLFFGLLLDYVMTAISYIPTQGIGSVVLSFAFGAFLGIAQWIYLRRYVERAFLWIIAGSLSWGLVMISTGSVIEGFLEIVIFFVIPPIITGLLILYFLSDFINTDRRNREIAV